MEVKERYKVYVDVLFIINFLMDYITMLVVTKFERIKIRKIRMLSGAMLGAIYTFVVLACDIPVFIENICTYIVVPLAMAVILIGKTSVARIIRATALVYIVEFLLGGIGQSLYYNTVLGYMIRKDGGSYIFIALTILAVYISVEAVVTIVDTKRTYSQEKMYEVTFFLNDKKYQVRGMVDTGNILMDNVYHVPVSVIERRIISGLEGCVTDPVTYKYHIIPYKSLGMEHGVMEVVEVKDISLSNSSCGLALDRMMLGVYDGKLSGDGEYSMLINSMIMKGGA